MNGNLVQQFPIQRITLLLVSGTNGTVGAYVNGRLEGVYENLGKFFEFLGALLFNKMTIVYRYHFVVDPSIRLFYERQNELAEWNQYRQTTVFIPKYDPDTSFVKEVNESKYDRVKFFCWVNEHGYPMYIWSRESIKNEMTQLHGTEPTFHEMDEYVRGKANPEQGWIQYWYGDDKFETVGEIWEHHVEEASKQTT